MSSWFEVRGTSLARALDISGWREERQTDDAPNETTITDGTNYLAQVCQTEGGFNFTRYSENDAELFTAPLVRAGVLVLDEYGDIVEDEEAPEYAELWRLSADAAMTLLGLDIKAKLATWQYGEVLRAAHQIRTRLRLASN